MQDAVEEEDEDGEDAEDADAHRQHEAFEQFFHVFCLAFVEGAHGGGQVLHGRGVLHGGNEFAELAAADLRRHADFAGAVEAGDL